MFKEMDIGFDSMVSLFIEETRLPDTHEVMYVNHEKDSTFVHGKIHRMKYLLDNSIRWNDNLTIHEDSFFNILCQSLSQNVKYCNVPFYLWKWRDNSVCRHDPKYILKTYNNLIDSNEALVAEFEKRNINDKVSFYVGFMIFDGYYTMNKPAWINQENLEYREKTERRFADYFRKHQAIWDSLDSVTKMQISNGVRNRSVMEGMQMETITINDWIDMILKKY